MKKFLQQTLCLTSALTLSLSLVLTGCGQENATDTSANGSPAVRNEVDVKIDQYEKTVKEFTRVARKLRGGDVSVTMKFIDLQNEYQTETRQLQAASLSPAQKQRVAEISARATPYLQP